MLAISLPVYWPDGTLRGFEIVRRKPKSLEVFRLAADQAIFDYYSTRDLARAVCTELNARTYPNGIGDLWPKK